MTKRAIITDTASGLNKEYIQKHDIKVIPMSIIIDGVAYREGVDLSIEQIYDKLKESGEGAKTSQPTIGDFIEVYEEIEADENYDEIIAIHAASELTGTYQSSLSASQEVSKPCVVIDSKIGSYPMKRLIEIAVESRENNDTLQQVEQKIKNHLNDAQLYIIPKSMNQMRKSGRVSASQSMLASLLNIQLQLKFDEGKVVIGEKVRTKKKLNKAVLNKLEHHLQHDNISTLAVLYAGNESLTEEWVGLINTHFPNVNVVTEPFVPVAGVHTGYGTVAIGFIAGE